MTTLKDYVFEVIANCKSGLIGSGLIIATQAVAELSGERQVRFVMMYIGLTVGVLTIVKLVFEIPPAWERFKDAIYKRNLRKQEDRANTENLRYQKKTRDERNHNN